MKTNEFNLMPFIKTLAQTSRPTLSFAELQFLLGIQRGVPVTISADTIEQALKIRLLPKKEKKS